MLNPLSTSKKVLNLNGLERGFYSVCVKTLLKGVGTGIRETELELFTPDNDNNYVTTSCGGNSVLVSTDSLVHKSHPKQNRLHQEYKSC